MLHRTHYGSLWARSESVLFWMAIIVAVAGGGSELTEKRYASMAVCLAVAAALYGLSRLVSWYSHR